MPWLLSTVVATDPATGSVKLGHPVPLSNFSLASNKLVPQPAQRNLPGRFSRNSAQLPGRSVACPRITAYCSGLSMARHSASVLWTGNVAEDWGWFMADSCDLTVSTPDSTSIGKWGSCKSHPGIAKP